MATENNTSFVNSFIKGMNTDASYTTLELGQYLYAENLRNYSLNQSYANIALNSYGEMRVIEGSKNMFNSSSFDTDGGGTMPFNIASIKAAQAIRDVGIVIAEDEDGNWGIIRFISNETDGSITEPELIFLSGDTENPTPIKQRLNGEKVSIVLTWETDENIKLYIADGEHFIKMINVAPSNDEYNRKMFYNPSIFESFKPIETRPMIFCGLVDGTLTGGTVQYSYRYYNKRGSCGRLSSPTKPIPLGKYNKTGGRDSDLIRGALGEENVYEGVSLKIPVLDYSDDFPMSHMYIYRIHHQQNGQDPEIQLIYDGRITPVQDSKGNYYMTYTDYGNTGLQTLSVNEYNSLSGMYIIPKVIESKNDRLFAANIKDDQSRMNEIGKLFDARAFRVNTDNHVVFQDGTDIEYNEFIKKIELGQYPDTLDCINPYNIINTHFKKNDKVCKFMPHIDGKDSTRPEEHPDGFYFGGAGKFISWKFVITKMAADIQQGAKLPDFDDKLWETAGAVGNYIGRKGDTTSKTFNEQLQVFNVYKYYTGSDWKNDIVDKAYHFNNVYNLPTTYSPSYRDPTYSNPFVSYAFKSMRRDELYRYGIVLYNSRGEGTSVLWIGDVRTPCVTEDHFEAYQSRNYADGCSSWQMTSNILGIEFNVDMETFNDRLRILYPEEYEDIKITSYEIVRCHRGEDDILTVSQGVVARPIQRTKPSYVANDTIDTTYTPTGTLTTQNFWTGAMWLSHNEDDSIKDDVLEHWTDKYQYHYEADNFENHKVYQFISPENVYNPDYMDGLYNSSDLYITPIKYIFGQHKDQLTIPTSEDSKDLRSRRFNKLQTIESNQPNGPQYLPFSHVSTAIQSHALALPLRVHYTRNPEGSDTPTTITGVYDHYGDYIVNYKGYNGSYLSGGQLTFIAQTYGRIGTSYYTTYTPERIFYMYDTEFGDGTAISSRASRGGGTSDYGYISSGKVKKIEGYTDANAHAEYIKHTFRKNGSSSFGTNGTFNEITFGYDKLYEQSNLVYKRNYDTTEAEDDEKVKKTIEVFGNGWQDYQYLAIDLDDDYQYEINGSSMSKALAWNSLFSSSKNGDSTTYKAKYVDNIITCGTAQFCNVLMGGFFNDTGKTLTTDDDHGLFVENNYNILDIGCTRSALIGTGGTTGVIQLKDDNNILYKNMYTDRVYDERYGELKASDIPVHNKYYTLTNPMYTNFDYLWKYVNNNRTSAYLINDQAGSMIPYVDYAETQKEGEDGVHEVFRNSVAGTYLCNIRKRTTPYGGYTNADRLLNTYVSYGDVQYDMNKPLMVFDGDCYIDVFEYTSCHKYYDPNIKVSITANINYAIPVESSINLAYTSGHTFTRNSDSQSVCQIQEEIANVNDFYIQDRPEYEYNTVYSVQPQVEKKEALDTSDDSNTLYDVDYRVFYSELKTNNENSDSWLTFKAANYLDVDDRYGEITHLRTFNDSLVFWQESATGLLSVNERTSISDDSGKPLILGEGGVLSRYDYLDRTAGMHKEQYCDACSNSVLYWFDAHDNEIKSLLGNGIVQMNKTYGTLNIMHLNANISAPVMFYDQKYNEVVSKVLKTIDKDKSLAYNELIKAFTSVYDVSFDESLTFMEKNYIVSADDGKLNISLWNTRDNSKIIPTTLRYVVNDSPLVVKVFDNQEMVTSDTTKNNPFNKHHTYSWKTDISKETTADDLLMTDREGTFRYAIPRVDNKPYGNRMRGKYMICEIKDSIPDYNVALSYIITKFRKSWI